MRCIPHRRIHLCAGSQALVALGRFKRKMVRRGFDRRHILVTGEEFHFLQRRDVQDVHAGARLARGCDETLRRLERGNLIAPRGMLAWIAF